MKFHSVQYKNFLSTGNSFTKIDLDNAPTTLVVGANGAGKSTMLDALSFGLFGKPYRNINKPQLINTINSKDCVVEVEFSVGPNRFKVIRGIKPNVFEIYKNGEVINESSHSKEFQKLLEQNILKLNHKSFHQIVVLGSSSFIPFMQLTAANRREVIEDLLDINIFSKMNMVLKDNIASLKDKIRDAAHQVDIVKNKIEVQRKYINDIKSLNEEKWREKQTEIKAQEDSIEQVNAENEEIQKTLETKYDQVAKQLEQAGNAFQDARIEKSNLQSEMKKLVKEDKFFQDNDVCPTCTQEIDENIKSQKVKGIAAKAKEIQKTFQAVEDKLSNGKSTVDDLQDQNRKSMELQGLLRDNNTKINMSRRLIAKLEQEITNTSDSKDNVKQAAQDLEDFIDQKDGLITEKVELSEEYDYSSIIADMLKDTGIKTKIIKQYLPVMNKLVNQYLQTLDFFVHFELNESFSETIRSRHRDSFSYDSFSEGEKQRIDLALLFTWRQIAKMKNSVATNLLILDETFDSSLDNDGVENLFKIIHTLGADTNVFVISHKGEILDGRFESKMEFYKDKNFSKMR
ncbi:AAA family ATPase [bacterium]|nr:AAA family ATPase [bacterium]